jgi:hypothetical protein
MRYEWNIRKNRENQRKHGVSFELAARVFDDESRLIRVDRVDETGEQRWHAIGAVSPRPGTRAVLIVAHVYRYFGDRDASPESPEEERDGEEIVRIISARPASNDELRRYEEQAVD